MKKRIKISLLFIAVVIISGTLCGCAGNNRTAVSREASSVLSSEPVSSDAPESVSSVEPVSEPVSSTASSKPPPTSAVPQPPPPPQKLNGAIPVFMYHCVSDNVWGIRGLFVSPKSMDEQLKYLSDNGYTAVTFEDFPVPEDIKNPVMLTFDDGYRDNYTDLFPILKKHNMKVSIFLITGSVGGDLYLTEEQIAEMQASGLVSFQSHTATHPDLTKCGADNLEHELADSAKAIEGFTGIAPIALVYPTGAHNDAVVNAAARHYKYALTVQNGLFKHGDDPYRISRRRVSRDTGLDAFVKML